MEFAELPWDFEREISHRPFPKTGSAVQRSVTAVSVKKAFKKPSQWACSKQIEAERQAVMLAAHTDPKMRRSGRRSRCNGGTGTK
jgi:hypothetical protein